METNSITENLTNEECYLLMMDLKELDKNIIKKVRFLEKEGDLSVQEALEFLINDNIALWAKIYCNWEARDYQCVILEQAKKSKKLVLRLGRRLGKTETMIISILWHAFRQPNKKNSETAAYEILILTPFETQVDLIFDRMNQIIKTSPLLQSMLSRSIHHRIDFDNGTIIKGLTVGSGSGNGAANTRGQAASKDYNIYLKCA